MNELRSADVSISKLQDFSLASPDPQGRSWVSHPNDEVLFSLANKLCTLNFLKQKHSCCGAVNKDQLHWISKKPWDHNFRRELSFSKSIKSNEARAEWSFEKHIHICHQDWRSPRESNHSKPQIPTLSHTCGNLVVARGNVWVGYVLNLCFFKHCLCSAKTENHPATQTESCALCERNLVVLVWRLSALGGCPHGLNGF